MTRFTLSLALAMGLMAPAAHASTSLEEYADKMSCEQILQQDFNALIKNNLEMATALLNSYHYKDCSPVPVIARSNTSCIDINAQNNRLSYKLVDEVLSERDEDFTRKHIDYLHAFSNAMGCGTFEE